jgi:uncharacterized protein YegL
MALSSEEQVLLDHLLAKQREDKEKNPEKYKRGARKLYVFKVLDKSGSMSPHREVTISTFNESLGALAESEVETFVTLIEFANNAHVTYRAAPFTSAPRLTYTSYNPTGMTALFDAIGKAFEVADALEADSNTSFLLEILTDGQENCSSSYSAYSIKNEIERRKRTGQWTVTVMGPKGSVNLFANMGVELGNIATFNADSASSRSAVKGVMSSATRGYVSVLNNSAGSVSVGSTYASVIGTNAGDVDDWAKTQKRT